MKLAALLGAMVVSLALASPAGAVFFAADPGDSITMTDGDGVVMTRFTPGFLPIEESFSFTYDGPGALPPVGNGSNLVLEVGPSQLTEITGMVVTITGAVSGLVSTTAIPIGAENVLLAAFASFSAGEVYTLTVTGDATSVGGGAYSVGLAFGKVVPVPAGLVLLASGLGVLGLGHKLRRRRMAAA